jgi:MraZ protein
MTEFFGLFAGTLDPKNRLHVPSPLRKAADGALDTCYLTLGLGQAIYLLPKDEWRRLASRFENYSQTNTEEGAAMRRVFFAYTYDVSLDKQGRVQIPQELVSEAGLEKDVKIFGFHRRIEIRSANKFASRIEKDKQIYEEKASQLFQ